MSRSTTLFAFLLALGFSAEVLGYLPGPPNALLGMVCLAACLAPYLSRRPLIGTRAPRPV